MIGDAFGGPGVSLVAVTPSDATDLTGARALYVGTTGNLSLKTIHGASNAAAVTMSNIPAGSIIPIQVTRVMAATTASDIVAIY